MHNINTLNPDVDSGIAQDMVEFALFAPNGTEVLDFKAMLLGAGCRLEEIDIVAGLSGTRLNFGRESDPVERARLEIAARYGGGGAPMRVLQLAIMRLWQPRGEFDELLRDYLLAGSCGRAHAAPVRQHLYDSLLAVNVGGQMSLLPVDDICPARVIRDVHQRASLWAYVRAVLGQQRFEAAPLSFSPDSPALHAAMWPVVEGRSTSRAEVQLLAAARTVDPSFQRLDDVINAL